MNEDIRKELDLLWLTMRELAQAMHDVSDTQSKETEVLLKMSAVLFNIKEITEFKNDRTLE
jgi:hypothetical protein